MATAQKRAQTITTTVGGSFNLPNNTGTTATIFDGHTATKNQNVYGAKGPFNIKLGSGHFNNVYFTSGNQAATSVTGLAGNDSLFLRNGATGTYTVNMGTGENTLSLDDNFGKVIYTTTNAAASTYDTLDLSNTTGAVTASLVATTAAVDLTHTGSASVDSTIADVHSMRAITTGSGLATLTLNNLDDTVTFGNGGAVVTSTAGTAATYGDDTYVFNNFTAATNGTTVAITDSGGNNSLDFSHTTSSISVTLAANSANGLISGTGAGLGHSESFTVGGTGATGGYINGVVGGSGNDTFSFGNSAGIHSINGGTGTNTLIYTGSQGVTMDVRDHEVANIAGTTDVTFHGFSNYKLLGAGTNTFIGDGSTGVTVYCGNGSNAIDAGAGSAATIHSDMGGNTTIVLGDAYGATTVTNTALNGTLTIDASGVTHGLGASITLGTTGATLTDAQASVTSVTWATGSLVNGFIGNDSDTTITGAGNYNFKITTGAGNDGITATGTGNNVISTGDGNDTVSVGTGNNTVIFGSGTGTTNVTAASGAGSNSIFCGGGTGTEALNIAGTGNNIIDFSNGGTHTVTVGTGANVLQGFTSSNNWSVDVTDAMNNAKGTLDLSNYTLSQVSFDDQHNLTGGKVTDLIISLDTNHTIDIHNYFDGSAGATAATSAHGTGTIQTLHFSDQDLTFANVQGLATTTAFH